MAVVPACVAILISPLVIFQVLVFRCSACKGDQVLSSNCYVEDTQRLQDNGKVKKVLISWSFCQKRPKTTRLPTNAMTPLPLGVHVSALFTIW